MSSVVWINVVKLNLKKVEINGTDFNFLFQFFNL